MLIEQGEHEHLKVDGLQPIINIRVLLNLGLFRNIKGYFLLDYPRSFTFSFT
jgi:hypothetical protein